MVDESVIAVVRRYLRRLRNEGLEPAFGVVFGSQVTGRTHRWSDIDLLVVSPRFDGVKDCRDKDLLWTSVIGIDTRIEPIACGLKQWEEDDGTPIIEVARRNGVAVNA